MAVQDNLTMRVYLSAGDIRKLTMTPRPDTLEDLIAWLKGILKGNFSLQYDDPDWGLCNLYDLKELPEKPTIHVIPMLVLETIPSTIAEPVLGDPTSAEPVFQPTTAEGNSTDTDSQADTDILSNTSLRSLPWPEVFQVPHFGFDVEYRLNEANLKYMQDQTYITVTKELKHKILHKLAETIYAFDPYPGQKDCEAVAKALLEKHPCLGKCSLMSWKKSLEFKFGNYIGDMKRIGRLEVCVNGGKRARGGGDDREPPNKGIKKARKGELNFLPHYEEKNDPKMEEARQALSNEMLKKHPHGSLIKKQMDITFAFRRKEIVNKKPDVSVVLERWPALFTESQVWCEFHRVVGTNLRDHFFGALDQLSSRLMDLFRMKKGVAGKHLTELLLQTKTTEPTAVRTLCLRGLPIILGDDPAVFFKSCSDVNESSQYNEMPVGILYNNSERPQLSPSKVGIILEGSVAMEVADVPQAVCVLFGLMYALHLDYPKCMKHTCHFIQQVMLNVGRGALPHKVQTLKDQLEL